MESPDVSKKKTKLKLVIQQCNSAKLKLPKLDKEATEKNLEISRGMVVFICFLKGAEQSDVLRAVQLVTNVKLCEQEEDSYNPSTKTKREDVKFVAGDLLIVPQATLGGKLKGKALQYHDNISKSEGVALYESFNVELKQQMTQSAKAGRFESGIYGARQVLSMDTNGPFTHIFEL